MESLQKAERAALVRVLDLLAAFGPRLQMPHARHIEGDMWELRAASGRLFYFCYIERRFIVLHGYRKKTRQAPRREINTALRRLDDFVRRERNAR
jgi:phage-related protein